MTRAEPELVVLVADADAEKLIEAFLGRSVQQGCLRQTSWVVVRDPMKDSAVSRDPTRALAPYLHDVQRRFLVVWDHDGSGQEARSPRDVEREVVAKLHQAGVALDAACAIAFEPELEAAFEQVWDRVSALVAAKRGLPVSSEADLLRKAGVPVNLGESLAERARAFRLHQPKEYLQAMLKLAGLRHEPSLFRELGTRLSVPMTKSGVQAGRLAAVLVHWFAASQAPPCAG